MNLGNLINFYYPWNHQKTKMELTADLKEVFSATFHSKQLSKIAHEFGIAQVPQDTRCQNNICLTNSQHFCGKFFFFFFKKKENVHKYQIHFWSLVQNEPLLGF